MCVGVFNLDHPVVKRFFACCLSIVVSASLRTSAVTALYGQTPRPDNKMLSRRNVALYYCYIALFDRHDR